MGQKLIYVPECHSTNSSLSELINQSELPEGLTLVTDHQTRGKGQRGSSWEARQGENLTFSVLLRPRFLATKDQFQLNMAIALGIADGLSTLVSRTVSLKWPNDIMVDDYKVGGVLIENQSQGATLSSSIVGIGININQMEFGFPQAASLKRFTNQSLPLADVFARLVSSLEKYYLQLRSGAVDALRQAYMNSLYRYRQLHPFETDGQRFVGMITDVDEYGRLCIQTEGSVRKFSLKEIKMVV